MKIYMIRSNSWTKLRFRSVQFQVADGSGYSIGLPSSSDNCNHESIERDIHDEKGGRSESPKTLTTNEGPK